MENISELQRLASPAPKPQSLAWDGATLWMGSRFGWDGRNLWVSGGVNVDKNGRFENRH